MMNFDMETFCWCLQQLSQMQIVVRSNVPDVVTILGVGFNGVIAVTAVATVIWPKISEWWLRKYKVILPDSKNYSYREEVGVDAVKGGAGANDPEILYSLPFQNCGNVKLRSCEIYTDCVLRRGKNGKTLDKCYFGLPKLFSDQSLKTSFDLPIEDKAYVRFLKFSPDSMRQSGIKDASGATNGEVVESTQKEKEKKDRSPGVIDAPKVGYSWGLVIAGCNNSSDGLIPLDVVSNVDYYVHVVCRADNLKKVYKEWVSVHWSGDEVDKDNLTIAKASSEDKEKCEAEYLLLSKEGE